MTACVVVGRAPEGVDDELAAAIPGVPVRSVDGADAATLAAAEALLVWDFGWQGLADLLPAMPRLRWIHAASAGVDHLLTALGPRPDVILTNSTGIFERPIAEYVLGLILAHAKGFSTTAAAQRDHRWAYRETMRVEGSTLVVVGAGRIGTAVATLARTIGMRVIGVRRTPGSGEPAPYEAVVGVGDLRGAMAAADFVVVTTPATTATAGLIDARAIAALRSTAYLVNVGRASAIDLPALVEALRGGSIAGAVLDVFETEPLAPTSPLWEVPRLLISPHMSGDVVGWGGGVVEAFVANLGRLRDGLPLSAVVDRARGY